ncbi:MAG: proteasome assembly chaperone family protein [Candidatus Methanomethylophilaceae archaeon]
MSDIKIFKYDGGRLNDAIAIVGFPTVGLVGSIVTSYIVRELKMPILRGMSSDDLSPYCILVDGEPYPPVRIHGLCRKDDSRNCSDLMVVTSEIAPTVTQCYTLTNELLDMFDDYGVKKVVCLEGIPRYCEDDVMYACGSTPGAREMIGSFGVEPLDTGMIKGLTGVMLFEGKERDIDIVTLLCPADPKLPDPRAAAGVLDRLAKVIPELKEMNTSPLFQEAEEIDRRIRAQNESDAPKALPEDQHIYG